MTKSSTADDPPSSSVCWDASNAPAGGRPAGDGLPAYFFGGTGLPPGSTEGGGKRSLRICRARIAA